MDANTSLGILSERVIKTDAKTKTYLIEQLESNPDTIYGKLCVARVGTDVVLAIGHPTKSLHMNSINKACMEVLGYEVARDTYINRKAKVVKLDGAIVEGISFAFHVSSGQMDFIEISEDFGGFRTQIFKDDTLSVAGRFLKDLVNELRGSEG